MQFLDSEKCANPKCGKCAKVKIPNVHCMQTSNEADQIPDKALFKNLISRGWVKRMSHCLETAVFR